MGVGRVRDDCSSLRRGETDPAAAAAVPVSDVASSCAVNDAMVSSSAVLMNMAHAAMLNRLRCGCMLVAWFVTRFARAVCTMKPHMQDSKCELLAMPQLLVGNTVETSRTQEPVRPCETKV